MLYKFESLSVVVSMNVLQQDFMKLNVSVHAIAVKELQHLTKLNVVKVHAFALSCFY